MKRFFKSDWFKCTAVLLGLLIIFSGTLAVLNDVLFVTAKERTDRAIKKIYGSVPDYSVELDFDVNQEKIENDYGCIYKIYQVGEDILFKSTGINGYKGGTISLWIQVIKAEGHYKIEKIILDGYEKQTLMSKFSTSYFNGFILDVTEAYEKSDFIFSPKIDASGRKNPMSGATYSANAACNAVNCVLLYLGGIV